LLRYGQAPVVKPQGESEMIERNLSKRQVFGQWVRATWAGWALGVPLIIVLALVGEAVGKGFGALSRIWGLSQGAAGLSSGLSQAYRLFGRSAITRRSNNANIQTTKPFL